MSLSHSSSVVTNGLVFYYDMNNSQKSWKGKPTTNFVTNPTEEMARGEFGQYRDLAPAFDANGLVPYSLSMDIKTNIPGSVLVYMQNGSSSKYGFVGANVTCTTQYQRFTFNNITPSLTGDGSTAATLATYTGYGSGVNPTVKNIQLELGSFATPFVNGTRSNTQTVLDMLGLNTITANSLTYNSDNTFSFDYASASNIRVPLAFSLNKVEGTMNFWVYPTRYNGGNGYFVNREDSTANALDWLWIGPYSDTFYFRIGNGVDCCSNDLSFSSVATVIPINTWTNMCFTWKSNGTSVIYKNGVVIASRSIGAIPTTNPASNGTIGLGHNNADHYFHGKMPMVQIYNRQLSSTEVKQNFNAQRGRYSI